MARHRGCNEARGGAERVYWPSWLSCLGCLVLILLLVVTEETRGVRQVVVFVVPWYLGGWFGYILAKPVAGVRSQIDLFPFISSAGHFDEWRRRPVSLIFVILVPFVTRRDLSLSYSQRPATDSAPLLNV
jgi:hypothetical protein